MCGGMCSCPRLTAPRREIVSFDVCRRCPSPTPTPRTRASSTCATHSPIGLPPKNAGFHLRFRAFSIFPRFVLKGIFHYWKHLYLCRGLKQMVTGGGSFSPCPQIEGSGDTVIPCFVSRSWVCESDFRVGKPRQRGSSAPCALDDRLTDRCVTGSPCRPPRSKGPPPSASSSGSDVPRLAPRAEGARGGRRLLRKNARNKGTLRASMFWHLCVVGCGWFSCDISGRKRRGVVLWAFHPYFPTQFETKPNGSVRERDPFGSNMKVLSLEGSLWTQSR